ncbi:hypothetical protein MRX96_003680 [Rhipicephalus microplus]
MTTCAEHHQLTVAWDQGDRRAESGVPLRKGPGLLRRLQGRLFVAAHGGSGRSRKASAVPLRYRSRALMTAAQQKERHPAAERTTTECHCDGSSMPSNHSSGALDDPAPVLIASCPAQRRIGSVGKQE